MSCGVGRGCSPDPVLLWPWYRPAPAALITPLAWEPPYAVDVALKSKTSKRTKQQELLLSAYYAPGALIGTGNRAENKREKS